MCGALLFQISENLLEFKPFKMSRKLPYFEKNQLCACVEERLYDVLLSFSNIAALIAGTLLLDWRENLIKRNIFLQCVFLY